MRSRALTNRRALAYTRHPMVTALEFLAAFYAFVYGWIALSILGAKLADRYERRRAC